MSFLVIMLLFTIMSIHFKTEEVKYTAVTWGIIFALLCLGEGFIGMIVGGVTAAAVAFGVFSLANYLEESIFLRLIVLLIGMALMIFVPSLMLGIV